MLDHITILGRFVRDFKSSNGGDKEVDFIDCVAWGQAGEFVSKYFTRGRMAVVSGRLKICSWTDKDHLYDTSSLCRENHEL